MKNIFVLSDTLDSSTDEILHWIYHRADVNVVRILKHDKIKIVDILIDISSETRFTIIINDRVSICSSEIHAYYFRRAMFPFQNLLPKKPIESITESNFYNSLNKYYSDEWRHTQDYLHYLLRHSGIKCLNSFFDARVNKLISLEVAKKFGLKIPATIVTNSVSQIMDFLTEYPKTIVKPIKMPGYYYYQGDEVISYSQETNLFTKELLDEIRKEHTVFQPTQFQEYIEKEFEIRCFYLKGALYSMAIFSQKNEKTKIDFRNYDEDNPNRAVPFNLPEEVAGKIHKLMDYFDFDSGSIDIIYYMGDYTFLEVNTGGIFEWLSKNCNYYIEKAICNYLIN